MKGATSHKNLRAHSGTFFGMNHQFRLVVFIQARAELVSIAIAASLGGWTQSILSGVQAGSFHP